MTMGFFSCMGVKDEVAEVGDWGRASVAEGGKSGMLGEREGAADT